MAPEIAGLDPAAIERLRALLPAGQDAMLAQLARTFVENAEQLLAQMATALASSDITMLQRAAHTLKSNAANFGAGQLEERSRTLEAALRAGDAPDAAGMVQAIRESWFAVVPAVEALTGG